MSSFLRSSSVTGSTVGGKQLKTICLTIDNSGSMGGYCNSQEGNYTRLDLVSYACILIVLGAEDGDEITVVKFSTTAQIVCEGVIINDSTRLMLINIIKTIRTEGSTNISDAIIISFDAMTRKKHKNFSVHLFTDGEDTASRISRKSAFSLTDADGKNLFIYGFSPAADVRDLVSISKDATMYFIPDYSMLLTNFVNGLANASHPETIILEPQDEAVRKRALTVLSKLVPGNISSTDKVAYLIEFESYLNSLDETPFVEAIKLDFLYNDESSKGQIEKSIRHEYFNSWGFRFLLSYQSSLFNMNCTNYKDNAPSLFTSSSRLEVIEECEDIIKRSPITSFITPTQSYSYSSGPVNSVYNRNGDSITGDSLFMTDEGLKRIDELTPHTIVYTDKGKSVVKFLVRMEFEGNVYKVGNIKLTAYHPYRVGGSDYFPIDRNEGSSYYKGYLYDLVLENRGNIKSKDIIVSCWGTFDQFSTQKEKDSIFNHAYFSSQQIVDEMYDLSDDQKSFLVDLYDCPQIRDSESGLVIGHDINAIKEMKRANELLETNRNGYNIQRVVLPITLSNLLYFPWMADMLDSVYNLGSPVSKNSCKVTLSDHFDNIENGTINDYDNVKFPESPYHTPSKVRTELDVPNAPKKRLRVYDEMV